MKKALLIATLALSVSLSAQEPPYFIVGFDYEVCEQDGYEAYLVKGEDFIYENILLNVTPIRNTSSRVFKKTGVLQEVRKYEGFYIFTTERCGQVESIVVRKKRSRI